jgi:excisionase family DNA binding protein
MDDDDRPIKHIDLKHDLNAKQVAEILCCSESHVYWCLNAGVILGYRTGRRRGWRVPKESLDRYHDQLRNGPDGVEGA